MTTNKDLAEDQGEDVVEGLDDEPSESWGDYPLDTVFVRKDVRTVGDVVARIKKGRYKLDPEFQRDFVWSPDQQARLIESSLMRIPLPVLYVAEDTDGKIIVVDGLQRLTTFYKYLDDEFSLRNIGSNDPDSLIRDKKFSELPIHLQERIEDTQLTLYILDSKAPERARLDIFERVNSGVPLTRQQMRNCLYSGQATRWLKKAAVADDFLDATGRSLKAKTMRDREVINRFCAFFILGYKNYKGDMEEYLADALSKMNSMGEYELHDMLSLFNRAMHLSFTLFGKHSFRKSLAKNGVDDARSVLNISLFDALSVALAKNLTILEGEREAYIASRVISLLRYEPFVDSISFSTNNVQQVRCRHQLLDISMGKFFDKSISTIIFYDVLRSFLSRDKLADSNNDLIDLADNITSALAEVSQFVDWDKREDIKSEFYAKLVLILHRLCSSGNQLKLIQNRIFSEARKFK